MTETKREPELWSTDDADENLTCESIDECVEEYLDGEGDDASVWPATIEVYGFARMKAKFVQDAKDLAQSLLRELDEEMGNLDGDGDPPEPSSGLLAAAQNLMDVALSEYRPWACEQVETVKVDVRDWLNQNAIDCWGEEEGKEIINEFARAHGSTP